VPIASPLNGKVANGSVARTIRRNGGSVNKKAHAVNSGANFQMGRQICSPEIIKRAHVNAEAN
jgi:hypothetical protein